MKKELLVNKLRNVFGRKILVLSFFLLASCSTLSAQNEALDSINLQLRELFSPLDKPTPSKWFLYDMVAHMTDSVFFQENCPDTNTIHIFQRVYEEIFYSAYDTTYLKRPEDLFYSGMSFTNDTIPLGIISFSHYLLKPEALNTDVYFEFDTVNTVLTDKYPRPSFPYNEGRIFMASPMVESTHFANVVFRVDPEFILFDEFNNPTLNHWQLHIDFGDGNGWVAFDHTIVTHHNVTYSSTGLMPIAFRWQRLEGEDFVSLSRIRNPNLIVSTPPDETLKFPGLTVGVFNSCNGNTNPSGRNVIYISGFDLMDFLPSENRTPQFIFSSMIESDNLVQLRNNGYRFLVVDWDNSRIDLRFNALYLVNMIQELKLEAAENGNSEPLVIIGESMGGVIARYVLTYMESEDFQNRDVDRFFADENDINNVLYLLSNSNIYLLPTNWDNLETMHNTRLLITMDSPHQGANIPISVQKGYRHALNIFGRYVGFGFKTTARLLNLFLDGQAAQQMLLYHVDTEYGSGFYKEYTRHPDGESFYQDLQQEGNGYPQFCKVVLMSNGALNGEAQTNYYTGEARDPNDRLIDFSGELYAKVLWIKVPIFGGDLVMRTNPDGNGHVFQANAGTYGIRIKLKWFGIRIHIGYNSLIYETDYANTLPFCTSAGGYLGERSIIPTNPTNNHFSLSNTWIFNLFSYSYTNDGNGCVNFDSHVGFNGLLSANFDFDLCSDGFYWNFVPIQSALDYGTLAVDPKLGHNIEADLIGVKLGSIPEAVDVIIGYPNRGAEGFTNRGHLGFRNDNIFNITGDNSSTVPPPGQNYYSVYENTYFSCVSPTGEYDKVRRGFLNLEIGDEELYLENNTLMWYATYTSEYDLHVNERNPHYEYPSQPNLGFPTLNGIYSKEDDFAIDNISGFAVFICDVQNTPTNIGFNYPNPVNSNYTLIDQPMDVCCHNYSTAPKKAIPNIAQSALLETGTTFISVFPNPIKGHQAKVKYKFNNPGKVTLEMYNMNGQRLLKIPLPLTDMFKENIQSIDLGKIRLSTGIYLIKLHNGNETLTTKIIITN